MGTKQRLLALLGTGEPPWTVSAIARAAGVPWSVMRRYLSEPKAGSRKYQARLDAFARLHSGDKHSERARG